MPFVDLPNEDVTMFYRTNLPGGEFGGAIIPGKPLPHEETILLLPGTMIDSRDMCEIFASTMLRRFNLVAVDPRSTGQTKNKPNLVRDAWTDAADFVKLIEALGLESVNVFAVSALSVVAAKRMACLWPEKVKSLVLVAIQNPDPEEWIQDSWNELLDTYLNAKDLETMEECINNFYPLCYGENLSEAKVDEVALYWETQYYPANGARFFDWATPFLLRQRLPHEYLELIRQPTLVMNGGTTLVTSPEEAELLQSGMVSATGGCKLVIFPDAPDQFHYIHQFSHGLVDEMIKFYGDLPKMELRPFMNGEKDMWKRALLELAQLRGDDEMKKRDPKFSSSFSTVPKETIEERKQRYAAIVRHDQGAFSPFGPNGELPRKFSERHNMEVVVEMSHTRNRSDSGLWANGVEQDVIESDEETDDTATQVTDLRKKMAKSLRVA